MSEKHTEETEMRKYRIGDFARNMGVTSSFLKHYEQFGLISSETTPSGYRYYPFYQSSFLLDCLSMRGYGFSLKETRDLVYEDTASELNRRLALRADEIRRNIERDQALLDEQEWFADWFSRVSETGIHWYITDCRELFFLPHTSGRNFLPDERIYEILQNWIDWLPIVKSCKKILCSTGEAKNSPANWGLAISCGFAKQHGIPVNSVVEQIPPQKTLVFDYCLDDPIPEEAPFHYTDKPLELALAQTERLGLSVCGDICQMVVLHTQTAGQRQQLGYFLIPVE